TGVDAVMIGRAAIGNPWIFARKDSRAVTYEDRANMIRKHLVRSLEFYGDEVGFQFFRRHAHKYIHAIPNASEMRNALANARTKEDVLDTLERYNTASTMVI
ncbi:MAG: tRNA-dihydrouridine synthase, partial [Chloroflexi bacterium]|nr:tRNA-dihydrouridine synthase [Chloroflexota bacterium]